LHCDGDQRPNVAVHYRHAVSVYGGINALKS
jgi:hypothetical protein